MFCRWIEFEIGKTNTIKMETLAFFVLNGENLKLLSILDIESYMIEIFFEYTYQREVTYASHLCSYACV